MNAQPVENGRSKAGIVLQAAGHGSGGSGIRISTSGCPLVDMDRNLRFPFLDSLVYAERFFRIDRQVSNNIVKIMYAAKTGHRICGFGCCPIQNW
jgi:hypothetical protein